MTDTSPEDRAHRGCSVRLSEDRDWTRSGGTDAVGYAFADNELLVGPHLAERIDATTSRELPGFLDRLNGSFAAVKRTDDGVVGMVDHIRSIPLFVSEDDEPVISDQPRFAIHPPVEDPPWERVAELLAARYVTGAETLLRRVAHIQAGTYVEMPRGRDTEPSFRQWFRFRPSSQRETQGGLVEDALETLSGAVGRALQVIGDNQIVVPLSGGLDSALLVHALCDHGVDPDQILTFTYGRPGEREVEASAQRAASFGLRWEFVPYSLEIWRHLRGAPWWRGFLRTASSLNTVPNIIDLPAVIELRDRGSILDDAVVIPGHTGDFMAGSWLPGSLARRSAGTRGDLVETILGLHYRCRPIGAVSQLIGHPEREVGDVLRRRIDASLPQTDPSMTGDELAVIADEWAWQERQAKFIVNSVRVYDIHGVRWVLPWWDRAVVDFWARVPLNERLGMGLREQMARAAGLQRDHGPIARLKSLATRYVRMAGIEVTAKRLRSAYRRQRAGQVYNGHPLALYGLVDEAKFQRWFTGHEAPWTFLGEEVNRALCDVPEGDPA